MCKVHLLLLQVLHTIMATMDQSQSRILIEGIGETKAVKAGHSLAMAWRLSNRYYPFLELWLLHYRFI